MIKNIINLFIRKSPVIAQLIDDSILRAGDQVVVNQGVKNPDNKSDISGYKGRIVDLDDEDKLVTIQWDSVSLQQMPPAEIIECEKKGLDWSEMVLYQNEVTKSRSRDSINDVKRVKRKLERQYYWYGFGDEGVRIQKVLENAVGDEDWNHFEAWLSFLRKSLTFPFSAKVVDWDDNKPFSDGDRIEIVRFDDGAIHGKYGVVILAENKGISDIFPLCCIEVLGKKNAKTRQIVSDYSFWFTNRQM